MRGRFLRSCGVVAVLAGLSEPAWGVAITYTATPLGGSAWRYDYTVENDSLPAGVAEFTIFFPVGQATKLSLIAAPPGWDALVVQPDPGLPDDGFLDALALAAGIALDASLGGFGVGFDHLGSDTPGPQRFQIVDPETFSVLESGFTTAVPEPAPACLLGIGVLALAARRGRSPVRRGP
jgi:hypothetical protein